MLLKPAPPLNAYTPSTVSKLDPAVDTVYVPADAAVQVYHTVWRVVAEAPDSAGSFAWNVAATLLPLTAVPVVNVARLETATVTHKQHTSHTQHT